jgi:hypothetical protein
MMNTVQKHIYSNIDFSYALGTSINIVGFIVSAQVKVYD